jgi:hypothetical protein
MSGVNNVQVTITPKGDGGVIVDLVAQAVKAKSEKIQRALIGYAKTDILKINLVFKRYNARLLNDGQTKKIFESLKKGIERYKPKNLITIRVKKEDVDEKTVTDDPGVGGDDFDFLGWKDDKAPEEVIACSGQHRVAALQMMKDEYERTLEKTKKDWEVERRKFQKGQTDDAGRARKLGDQVSKLEAELRGLSMWGIVIYDIGE